MFISPLMDIAVFLHLKYEFMVIYMIRHLKIVFSLYLALIFITTIILTTKNNEYADTFSDLFIGVVGYVSALLIYHSFLKGRSTFKALVSLDYRFKTVLLAIYLIVSTSVLGLLHANTSSLSIIGLVIPVVGYAATRMTEVKSASNHT